MNLNYLVKNLSPFAKYHNRKIVDESEEYFASEGSHSQRSEGRRYPERKLEGASFIFMLLIAVFWSLWLPGPRVANDYHYLYRDSEQGVAIPYTWRNTVTAEGLGEYSLTTLWAWPYDFFINIFRSIGFSSSFITRIVIVGILVMSVFSMEKLLLYLGLLRPARYLGILVFTLNTYILLLIDGGQLNLGLAYSILPLSFLFFRKAEDAGNRKDVLLFCVICFLISIFDLRILYMVGILVGVYVVYMMLARLKYAIKILNNFFVITIFTAIILAGLHSYWLLPSIFAKAPSLPSTYNRQEQVSNLSFATLGHSLTLLQPHWPKNVFGETTSLKPEFMLIPLLVFLAPILRLKDKKVAFWLIIALVGIFLVKGSNPPLTKVYPWLFKNLPGFSLFRDPTKFFFLVSLSYSVLIGISTDELVKRFNWKMEIGKRKIVFIPLLLVSYFIILIRPVWLGKMTGIFSQPIYQDNFFKIADILRKDSSFGRVFWIPTRAPLGYSSPRHPSVEALRLVQKRPFAIGTVGSYETFNYLREAAFMGELFDIAGIKYIAYPYPDTRREELKKDNVDYYYAFLDQLTNLRWVEDRITDPPVPVLKVKNSEDHFFITKNTFLVVGSDQIYSDLVKIKDLRLSNNALIFAEEKPEMGNTCKDRQCTVILYDKDETDFTTTFIDKSKFIFPAEYLDFNPNETGWWKRETADLIWWRNFLQQKYSIDNLDFDYGGGYSIAEGSLEMQITNDKFQKGDILLARLLESGKSGKVEFFQGKEKIGEVTTKAETPEKVEIKLSGYKEIPDQVFEYGKADFKWIEIGKLSTDETLTIKTEGDINVVNSLVSVSLKDWKGIGELIHRYKILHWKDLSEEEKINYFITNNDAEMIYERINSTNYKVKVEGITKPVTLAFSETYDPMWEITNAESGDKKNSYPLYSLINGFYIEKDGEYDIYYSPQKYVLPGLIISGTTLIIIFSSMILLRKRNL